ncbi:MAG: TolC family protein [Kiritimatiellia bacterium]|nr:TolC family protein [Kiritimatiellia bacterium]
MAWTGSTCATASPDPLRELVEAAWQSSPEVAAARHRIQRTETEAAGIRGFFDPRAALSVGISDPAQDLFGLTLTGITPDDTAALQVGVETALQPGFHVGIGAAQVRQLSDGEPSRDGTLLGARIRIPLARDRGFRDWRARRGRVEAAREAARENYRAVTQKVEKEVELRFIDWQHALAQRSVARAALDRAEQLFREAEELVRLEAVPAYQVHLARLEVARRQEEETGAEGAIRSARIRMEERIGRPLGDRMEPLDFVVWGSQSGIPEKEPAEAFLSRRGDYGEQIWRVAEQAARLAEIRETTRSDLSLQAGYVWDETGNRTGESGTESGGDVTLVWRKVLGDRTATSALRAQESAVREESEILRGLERERIAEAEEARADFESAVKRFAWMADAESAARAALAAEEERFRLGEGASRQVLDAQKDLTDMLRRRNDLVADVLRARARYRYATGLGGNTANSAVREKP